MPSLACTEHPEHNLAGRIVFGVSLVLVITMAPSTLLTAEVAQPISDHTAADSETLAHDDRSEGERPTNAPGKAPTDGVTDVEIQQMENRLRRQLLNDRATTVDWWLASTAVFLTLLGVVAAIAGYLSFKKFHEIEGEARNSAESSRQHAEEARTLVEEIKVNAIGLFHMLDNYTPQMLTRSRGKPVRQRKASEQILRHLRWNGQWHSPSSFNGKGTSRQP